MVSKIVKLSSHAVVRPPMNRTARHSKPATDPRDTGMDEQEATIFSHKNIDFIFFPKWIYIFTRPPSFLLLPGDPHFIGG